jgi:hypothetical protein
LSRLPVRFLGQRWELYKPAEKCFIGRISTISYAKGWALSDMVLAIFGTPIIVMCQQFQSKQQTTITWQ